MSVSALPTNQKPDRQADIRAVVREAFTEYHLLYAPGCVHELMPPCDPVAERQIVSAMLCDGASCQPLTHTDFFVQLHAGIVQALSVLREAGKPVPIGAVVAGLERLGFAGDLVSAVTDVAGEPYVVDLTDCMVRVKETSRRRRLLAWLRKMEAGVATGIVSVEEALAQCARVRSAT